MSNGVPGPTAWAAVLATVVAIGGLATVEISVAVGVAVGVALGISVHGLGRSPLTTTLAAAALPLGSFGAVVAIAQSGGGRGVAVTLTGIVVGVSLVSLPAGRLRADQGRLAAVSACLCLPVLALAAVLVGDLSGATTASGDTTLVSSPGGFAGLLVVAGGVTTVALFLAPSPFVANLRGQPPEHATLDRDRMVPADIRTTVTLTGLLVALVLVGSVVPLLDGLVETVATSGLAQGLVVAFTAVVACAWLVALLASGVWATGRTLPAVPLGLGAVLGAGAVVALDGVAGAEYGRAAGEVVVPTLLGVLAVGAIAAWRTWNTELDVELSGSTYPRGQNRSSTGPSAVAGSRARTSGASLELSRREDGFADPWRLVPLGIVVTVVLLAVGADGQLALEQAGLLVALAGALFAHTSLTRGLAAARDVGDAVAVPTQFVWLGWTGTVALVGLTVAVATVLLSTALGDLFSTPAVVGVVAGLATALAGLGLLGRRVDSL